MSDYVDLTFTKGKYPLTINITTENIDEIFDLSHVDIGVKSSMLSLNSSDVVSIIDTRSMSYTFYLQLDDSNILYIKVHLNSEYISGKHINELTKVIIDDNVIELWKDTHLLGGL